MRTLFVSFEGEPGQRKPVRARTRHAREGHVDRVRVDFEAVELGVVHLLFRRGEDLVLCGSAQLERVEAMRPRTRSRRWR